MFKHWKTLIALGSTAAIIGTGATTFAATPSTPKSASHIAHSPHKGHAKAWHRMHKFSGIVKTLTSSSVTVTLHPKHHPLTKTFPLSQIHVRAGLYPANSRILATGEHVSMLSPKSTSPTLIVWPVASGHLQSAGTSQWTISNKKHHWTFKAPSLLYGTRALSNNLSVAVYGTRGTNKSLNAKAVAQTPIHTVGTIAQNNQGILTIHSAKWGNLTYNTKMSPFPWTKHLAHVKIHARVHVILSPSSHSVLAIAPVHKSAKLGHQALSHMTLGTLTTQTANSFTLKNTLGSIVIPYSASQMHIVWKGHSHAQLSQIPTGTRLLVNKKPNTQNVFVRVIPHSLKK